MENGKWENGAKLEAWRRWQHVASKATRRPAMCRKDRNQEGPSGSCDAQKEGGGGGSKTLAWVSCEIIIKWRLKIFKFTFCCFSLLHVSSSSSLWCYCCSGCWLLVVVVVGALTPRCLNIDKPLPAANGRHKRACPGGRGGGGGGCAEWRPRRFLPGHCFISPFYVQKFGH